MHSRTASFSLATSALLLTIACGPPRPTDESTGASSSTDDSDSSSTDDPDSSSTDDPDSSSTDDPETGEPSTTEAETTDETTFVPEYDVVDLIECDKFEQDCPEGEKCVPYSSEGFSWDANKCVPVLGEKGPGEPCTYAGKTEATDDCDATSYCWDTQEIDGEQLGVCRQFCTGSDDNPQCPEGSECALADDGVINLCLPICDPVAQDCEAGFGCYWAGSDFSCVVAIEQLPIGAPCSSINDCAIGLGCMQAELLAACEGSACCASFCALELGDGPCEAAVPGTACVAFFADTAPLGYEHIGVCILPQP